MKIMSNDELKIRLRRTLTNKFSTTISPKDREHLRTAAFKNESFIAAVDKACDVLVQIVSERQRSKDA